MPLRERFIAAKSSLLENIAIAAGSEAKQLGTLAGELLQLGEGAGNIFELRQAELAAETDAEVVLENSRRFSAELAAERSEEHTSELQSLMRISYAVFCLKKKNNSKKN